MNAAPLKDDFDWRSDDSIVLREQLSIAIYVNTMGGVVIRREMLWDEEGDTTISFRPENVEYLGCGCLRKPPPRSRRIPFLASLSGAAR